MNNILTKANWVPAMKIVEWDSSADKVLCSDRDSTESYSVSDLETYYPHIRQGLRAARCKAVDGDGSLGGHLEKWGALLRQPVENPPILGVANVLTGYQLGWLARWIDLDVKDYGIKVTIRKVAPGDSAVGRDFISGAKLTLGCTPDMFEANFPGVRQAYADCELLGMTSNDAVPILRTMILDQLRNVATLLPADISPA